MLAYRDIRSLRAARAARAAEALAGKKDAPVDKKVAAAKAIAPPFVPLSLAQRRYGAARASRVGAMGAPPPQIDIDVATDRFRIGNARAEVISLGRQVDAEGDVYNGVTVVNNLTTPLAQPDVSIGSVSVAPGGFGSQLSLQGRFIEIFAEEANGDPGVISLIGTIQQNGGAFIAEPAYLNVWSSAGAATVNAGDPVVFPNLGLSLGGISIATNTNFTIPPTAWGTYEITWRVTVATTDPTEFSLRLVSGAPLAAPDAAVVNGDLISRTSTGLSASTAGDNMVITGQALVGVPQGALANVVLSLCNSAVDNVAVYNVGVPANFIIRRIAQAS
jgi:hypothetical protein